MTGEAGIGKSTLVEAFLQRIAGDGKSRVERGQCVEQYGQGEAYLPVLEALGHSCQRPGAERTIDILRRYAPTWLVQMPAFVPDAEFEVLQRKVHGATRERMLREMAEALEVMTAKQCSVVVLEDLQWSDHATLDLLSYVAQRREPARLLVIGTYRPTDVIVSDHPIKGIKQDLQGRRLCAELALSLLPEVAVGQYLDERFSHHQFPQEFAQTFYRGTDGNPLFMVNVADYIEGQGFVGTVEGHWQLKTTLREITTGIPDSLRQMIERQIDRLSEEERNILEAGSVVGADFSSAAAAAAMGSGEGIDHIEERCEILARRGHFLRANGTTTLPDGTVTEGYGFLHALYQQVFYSRLSASRARRFHHRIGEHLDAVYGTRAGEIAAELANHFEHGQDHVRTISYLEQAARNAIRCSAHREAIDSATRGIELLKNLPNTPERIQHEISLQFALGVSLLAIQGYAASEVEKVYIRARALCQQVGETLQLFSAIFGLFLFYIVRAEHKTALELGEQVLRLAQQDQDSALALEGHLAVGLSLLYLGELTAAQSHLKQCISLYDFEQHRAHALLYGQDPGVACRAHITWPLWLLGYPDQALKMSQEALGFARELAHPFSLAFALHFVAFTHEFRREGREVRRSTEELIHFTREQGFPFWLMMAIITWGGELAREGQVDEGIKQMEQGLTAHRAMGSMIGDTYWFAILAEGYWLKGQPAKGLEVLEEAFTLVNKNGERWWEADLYRLKGELLIASYQGKNRKTNSQNPKRQEAEQCFQQALSVARRQSARSLELRAATSLARLWEHQGKRTEAHSLLSEIYNWFTEGFDTKDLQEAKALLESLESGV